MFKAASRFLCLLALLLLLAGNARAFRFFYASECEQTRFGEFGYLCWEDTVTGPVQCNSQMRLNDCVFADTLYISCHPPYMPCDTPDAVFLVPPVFNAPHLVIPHQLTNLRNPAIAQGNVFDEPYKSYRVYLRGDSLTICRWWTGTLFDSTDCWSAPIFNGSAFFFDAPLQIQGHLTGQLYMGCSKTILLEDNIIYDDANPENGETPENSNNLLVLASEKEIKVANTCANGRNNSNGLGYNQTNPDSTSIVITAALYALGESFTFEQQNDRDSGYVYTEGDSLVPHTDDRGTVYLYGGLTQWRRGYLHRSNNGSTGYLKRYHYDRRFHTLPNPYPFRFERPYYQTTEAIDFGGVPLGQTVWDTA